MGLNSVGRVLLVPLIIACAAEHAPLRSAPPKVVRTVSGDTTIVRNDIGDPSEGLRSLVPMMTIGKVAGPDEFIFGAIRFLVVAPDSNIWIYDSQLKSLRVYSKSGEYVRQVGRAGNGPGEYTTVRGLTLLGKDKVVLCIPRGPSMILYGLDGRHTGDWKLADHGVSSSCDMLYSDTAGTVYVLTNLPATSAPKSQERKDASGNIETAGGVAEEDRIGGFISILPDGAVLDSMPIPYFGFAAPILLSTSPADMKQVTNTFSPREIWALSKHGDLIWARTDRYAISLVHRDGKVTRIERTIDAVPYGAAEIEETVTANTVTLRCADPAWKHPEFPATKMFFRGVATGNDGTLWVQVSTPSEVIPDSEVVRTPLPDACPPTRPLRHFRDALVYDVFDPSGEFLGRVPLPGRASILELGRDFVWLRTLDENDVQSATKFRIEPPFGRK